MKKLLFASPVPLTLSVGIPVREEETDDVGNAHPARLLF
jgi:hypothetical protein